MLAVNVVNDNGRKYCFNCSFELEVNRMSVLIKGMTMPEAGSWKTIRIYYDGTCAEPNWQGDCKVMKGCEAVHIPDHGDLVDKNRMFGEFVIEGKRSKRYKIGEKWELNGEEIRDVISRLPAIIPVERSEE